MTDTDTLQRLADREFKWASRSREDIVFRMREEVIGRAID